MPGNYLSGLGNSLANMQAQQAMAEQAMRARLVAAQNSQLWIANDAGTLQNLTVRLPAVSLGTAVGDLFFKIPSVAYLVEKIPAAKAVLAKDGITAAYLNEAKSLGLSLRQQCKDLGIPWSARLLTATEVSDDTVRVAAILEPTVFAQAKPKERIFDWAHRIVTLQRDGARKSVIDWAAWHILEVGANDLDYLRGLAEIAPSTKASTVIERSRVWHEAFYRQRPTNLLGGAGYQRGEKAQLPKFVDWECQSFRGYEFHPLRTYGDFENEGSDLRHCVASRFKNAKDGLRVYFSLRQNGKRVATAEYEKVIFSDKWTLREIKSLSNREPAPSAKEAAVKFEGVLSGKIILAKEKPATAAGVETIPQKSEYDSKAWTG